MQKSAVAIENASLHQDQFPQNGIGTKKSEEIRLGIRNLRCDREVYKEIAKMILSKETLFFVDI
jgi:hypothetical protein